MAGRQLAELPVSGPAAALTASSTAVRLLTAAGSATMASSERNVYVLSASLFVLFAGTILRSLLDLPAKKGADDEADRLTGVRLRPHMYIPSMGAV